VLSSDRMLVQISYTESEGLPSWFDEDVARKHPDIDERAFGEYIVKWTDASLELYRDHVCVCFFYSWCLVRLLTWLM
jgi:hypothetical protein